MGEVGHVAAALGGTADIRDEIQDSQRPDGHRQDAVHEHRLLGEVPDESGEHRHHSAGRADEAAPLAAETLADHPGEAGEHDCGAVEAEELSPSRHGLEFPAKEPEREHVEQQVHRRILVVGLLEAGPVVQEAVAEQRPEMLRMSRQVGSQAEQVVQRDPQREEFAEQITGENEVGQPDRDVEGDDRVDGRPFRGVRGTAIGGVAAILESHRRLPPPGGST